MRASRTFKYGAHDVTIETGVIARQADGAVIVNMADTVVKDGAVKASDVCVPAVAAACTAAGIK